ncbi:MAG: tetratricopeptide repeat protein [candidate division KSB1 bacterium]|nr:tetratricopeptide repeat protein [candidate division KSB1 bacterium]
MKYFLIILILLTAFLSAAQDAAPALEDEQAFRFAAELQQKELYDLAAAQFQEYADTYPTSFRAPVALLRAGQNYENADSLLKASNVYLSLLLKYPESNEIDQAQFSRAGLLAKTGQNRNAALAYERLRVLNEDSPLITDAQLRAAEQYLATGLHQKAMDAAFYVLEQEENHLKRLNARYLVAKSHYGLGNYKDALQVLDDFSSATLKNDLEIKILALKSDVYEKLGRYSKADSIVHFVLRQPVANPELGKMAVDLASSLHHQKRYAESDAVIQLSLDKVKQDSLRNALLFLYGDNAWARGHYQTAGSHYARVQLNENNPERPWLWFKQAMAAVPTDPDSAELFFTRVLQWEQDMEPWLYTKTALEFAKLQTNTDARNGVRTLQQAQDKVRIPAAKAELLFEKGQIQRLFLKDFSGARASYSSIISSFPNSHLIDDAQFRVAQTYEQQNRYQYGMDEYRRYLNIYPGGDFQNEAQQRLSYLTFYAPPSSEQAAEAFSRLLSANSASSQLLLDRVETRIHTFHDYQRALTALNQVVNSADETLPQDKLFYYQALCYDRLMMRMSLDQNAVSAAQYSDSLIQAADRFMAVYRDSPHYNHVLYMHTQAQLSQIDSAATRAAFLADRIDQFIHPDDSLALRIQYEWAREKISSGPLDSSDTSADSLLLRVAEHTRDGSLRNNALFGAAVLQHERGQLDSARSLLMEIVTRPEPERKAEATFLLAGYHQQAGAHKQALALYDKVAQYYFYSRWASRARVKAIDLLMQLGEHRQANQRLEDLRNQALPARLKLYYDQVSDDETLWLWARSVERMKSIPEAVRAYKMYLERNDAAHRAEALFRVGELANASNQLDMAIGHYRECADFAPQDSLGRLARYKTADIYFQRGRYEQALEQYELLNQQFTGDLRRQAEQNAIICEYQLDHLRRAQRKVQAFTETWDDRNAEARFLYQEGLYHIRTKNFDDAERAFKQCRKYDDVPQGARGELGLARLYVVLNKTEEALKRLTRIPGRYDDPDIVATAYVNLGDFYYENRQLQNCIAACKKALETIDSGRQRAQALDLLVNAYDDLNLRDKAIAMQKQYIREFPDNPSVLRRRMRIGVFLYYMKEYDRAIHHFNEIKPLLSADDYTEVQYWIAKSYADAGLTEKSVIEFLKVRYMCKQTKLPWGATALYEAGRGYRKLGKPEKAIRMFELVVRERGAADNIGRAASDKIKEIQSEMAETL